MPWHPTECPARLVWEGQCRSPWPARASGEDDDIDDDHEESWRGPPDLAATATLLLPSKPAAPLCQTSMEPLRCSMPAVWIDPMLKEFSILLQVATSSATVAPHTGDPSSSVQTVPPQRGPIVLITKVLAVGPSPSMDALMAEQATSSLSNAAPTSGEVTAPSQPLVPESALRTPPRAGQLDVVCGDETPTPLEAAQCLARFLDEVRVEQEPPLIASPPRQRTPVRRPPPVRPRSSRIAAQPLEHIPAFKRGEVLLNRQLGIAPPTAPDSPAPRGILDALHTGPCRRARWRAWTRCSQRLTGARASSSGRTRRMRR